MLCVWLNQTQKQKKIKHKSEKIWNMLKSFKSFFQKTSKNMLLLCEVIRSYRLKSQNNKLTSIRVERKKKQKDPTYNRKIKFF